MNQNIVKDYGGSEKLPITKLGPMEGLSWPVEFQSPPGPLQHERIRRVIRKFFQDTAPLYRPAVDFNGRLMVVTATQKGNRKTNGFKVDFSPLVDALWLEPVKKPAPTKQKGKK